MSGTPGNASGVDAPTPGTADIVRHALRIIEVTAGQRVQGTLVADLGGGRVLLGLLGGLVEARSRLDLEVGGTYEFKVRSTEPRIVLGAVRPVGASAPGGALAAGLLGGPGPAADLVARFVAESGSVPGVPRPAAVEAEQDPSPRRELVAALENLRRGAPRDADLRTIHRLLGHDQEARVSRLPTAAGAARDGEVEVLKQTLKADALRSLDRSDAGGPPARVAELARELVAGLNGVELDNARRTEQGAPQWLPLPVAERGELRDARMFLLGADQEDAAGAGAAASRPFTVVLLLDFTRLGQLRVDLCFGPGAIATDRGPARLSARFVAVESSAVHRLVGSMAELRGALERAGLEVGDLSVRAAPSARLPVADLMVRPTDGVSMVDLHV